MKLCKFPTLFTVLLIVCSQSLVSQTLHLEPGVDRWQIKTTVLNHQKSQIVAIDELLGLPNPVNQQDSRYDTTRIPIAVGPRHLKEGDFVTTTAWLHLVALEDDAKTHRDGDYHIQIRNSAVWADSCLVVEVTYPPFISDTALAAKCSVVRQFIKNNLLQGKEPGIPGNKLAHAVYVTITGQLFFDLPHVQGNPRGKRGMHSYTPWEIHPITAISFAPKPK